MKKKNKVQTRKLSDRSLYRRHVIAADLVSFEVTVKETDLMIMAEGNLASEARDLVLTHRLRLEEYLAGNPEFLTALEPIGAKATAPEIVRVMSEAARKAGVGPMAAVAGVIAELVGSGLKRHSRELIVENGGDLYLTGLRERVIAIYTAEGELGTRLGIRVVPGEQGVGVCTSSGRFGHSLSLGKASTTTVIAPSAALADASATAVGNLVRGREGLERGMELARKIAGVTGAVIVHEGRFGAWGDVEILRLDGEAQS
jgi:ApbE superfamily uncharacterized protein (UPF0280 family)